MNYYPSYLVHFGIKGQKWGIRRYQNEDGTLTPEGKRRYLDDLKKLKIARNESKKEYKKYASAYGAFNKKSKEAYAKYMYDKREYENLKNTFKMQKTKKDKRQLKFEEEYIKKGMRKEDAEMQAYKRRKTEKLLTATAALTVTAIAGVAAYKIYEKNADKIIKKGTKFHRMIGEGEYQGVEDVFVSKNLYDRQKYLGIMAKNKTMWTGKSIKELTIEAEKDVKLASRKNARKTLEEMFKQNPEMMDEFKRSISTTGWPTPKQNGLMIKAKRDLSNGKISDNVYDAFNLHFVGENKQAPMFRTFRENLNKKGYGVIMDMNDHKYSGFGSLKPLILIDRNNSFSVKDIRNVSTTEVFRNNDIAYTVITMKDIAPFVAAPLAANKASKIINSNNYRKKDNELVAKYQKEHPGTKMTYNEILRDIYKR